MKRAKSTSPALALALLCGSAGAAPITLELSGTVRSMFGPLGGEETGFEIGDTFVYRMTFEDGMTGPLDGRTSNGLDLMTDFRARVGDYRVSGSRGNILLGNERVLDFYDVPFDILSINHRNIDSFVGPGSDFDFTSGEILGVPLQSLGLQVQQTQVDFIDAGDSLLDIAESLAAQLDTLQKAPGPGTPAHMIEVSLRFSESSLGAIPLSIIADVDSLRVNPLLSLDPVISGTAAAAIAKDNEFGHAVDVYSTSEGDPSYAFASSTGAGTATARAELTDATIVGNEISAPGLEVGAYALGASGRGDTDARSVAFRSYVYEGDSPLRIDINSVLEGSFEEASFDLPDGSRLASGGIYVFDALEFADAFDWLGGDLEDIFFPLAGKRTDDVDSDALRSLSVPELLGLNPLASLAFTEGFAVDESPLETVIRELTLPLDLMAGQSFTLLYDLAVSSDVTCFGGQCGAGAVDFFNSLSSTDRLFTDAQGNRVTSISALGAAAPISVPEPPVTLLLLSLAALPLVRARGRRYARCS